MNERDILERFRGFDVGAYCQGLRESGRLAFAANERGKAADLYELLRNFRRNQPNMSPEIASLVDLSERFLYGEWYLHNHGYVNYPSYISGAILKLALKLNRRQIMSQVMQRAREVFASLLLDMLSVETATLADIYPYYPQNTSAAAVRRRVRALRSLCERVDVAGASNPTRINDALPADWRAYTKDQRHLVPLVYMATFPLTLEHDEFFFIRTLQMSECCFWGALAGTIAAIELGRNGDLRSATAYLGQAASFISLLISTTHALKTMPPEHFWVFRDATDGSSAIQSRAYHLLLIHAQGFDERKTKVFAEIPEISDLLHFGNRSFLSLRGLLVELHNQPPGGLEEFTDAAQDFDKALYDYRALHLGIVHRYIPQEAKVGTGGTTGISYLRAHFKRRLWPLHGGYPFPDSERLEALSTVIPLLGHGN